MTIVSRDGDPQRILLAFDPEARGYPSRAAEAWLRTNLPDYHLVPMSWWPEGPCFWGGERVGELYAVIAYGKAPTKVQWMRAMKPRSFDLGTVARVGAGCVVSGMAA